MKPAEICYRSTIPNKVDLLSMKIEYHPIGIIHSPHKELSGMPIQPTGAEGIRGSIEVFDAYVDGLADLDGFSHLILLYHFHRSAGFNLKVVPFLDTVERGLFATRAPRRPNPIGLSIVKLLQVKDSVLEIENVDILSGTPLLDIKPYVPAFDERTRVRTGWLNKTADTVGKRSSDRRFET
jgi:tRNA-Thr(GGU) m(6)t(6)A37 methyltransferase TsaA